MSRKYKFRDQEKPYFISFATVNWIDVFTRRIYKDILVDSINYCIREKGLVVYGWCIMTNHVHMIIATPNGASVFPNWRKLIACAFNFMQVLLAF